MVIKLVIDEGNTFTKIALYADENLTDVTTVKSNLSSHIMALIDKYSLPQSCILSSVKGSTSDLAEIISRFGIDKLVEIRSGIRLPIKVAYKTPETLGSDRLANACAASNIYPGQNVLIVDLGTCIKYDLVTNQSVYLGGSISPGLKMRYKSLSSFTGQLPYYKPVATFPELIGQSTEASMRSGVENGIIAELEGIISRYKLSFEQLIVIFTGGDHQRFADKLKSAIFVAPNLTLNGLKVILDHNDL